MTPKSPSLTAYDFLGYMVPGLGMLALIDISLLAHESHIPISCADIMDRYSKIKIAGAIPILLASYIVGHLVSFASSILIEKHVHWLHGSPTNTLLNHGVHKGYLNTSGSANSWLSWIIRVVTFIIILPISFADFIFTRVMKLSDNYIKPLDDFTQSASASAFGYFSALIEADEDSLQEESEVHDLTIHCALETAPQHVSSLRNYVVLYGFMRCMTFLLLCITWGTFIHMNGSVPWQTVLLYSIPLLVVTWLSYASYLKFFYRYHKESIMALIAGFANRKVDS